MGPVSTETWAVSIKHVDDVVHQHSTVPGLGWGLAMVAGPCDGRGKTWSIRQDVEMKNENFAEFCRISAAALRRSDEPL